MAIPHDALTTEVMRLCDDLRDLGYAVENERYDEDFFGNVVLTLRKAESVIRIVRDRNDWSVEVAADDEAKDGWFPPSIWHAYLTDSVAALDSAGFDAQMALLRNDLDAIEKAIADQRGELSDRLRLWRAERAKRREERREDGPSG